MERRYEISILVGPCSQEKAEAAMVAAHEAAAAVGVWPGSGLNFWLEDENEPGLPVMDVEVR